MLWQNPRKTTLFNRVTRLSFRVRHRGYIRWWDHGVLGIYCVYCVGLQGLPQTNNNLVISFCETEDAQSGNGILFLNSHEIILNVGFYIFNSAVISRRVAGGGGLSLLVRSPAPLEASIWNDRGLESRHFESRSAPRAPLAAPSFWKVWLRPWS